VFFQLIEDVTRRCDIGVPIKEIGNRIPGSRTEQQNEGDIDDRGSFWKAHNDTLHRVRLAHLCTVKSGLMRASIWNRSPGSLGERVVGAKKVARVK
jgi:hypothetical protein